MERELPFEAALRQNTHTDANIGESLDYRSVDNYFKERTEERRTKAGFTLLHIHDDDEDER